MKFTKEIKTKIFIGIVVVQIIGLGYLGIKTTQTQFMTVNAERALLKKEKKDLQLQIEILKSSQLEADELNEVLNQEVKEYYQNYIEMENELKQKIQDIQKADDVVLDLGATVITSKNYDTVESVIHDSQRVNDLRDLVNNSYNNIWGTEDD